MKKLLGILVLGLLWYNVVLAEFVPLFKYPIGTKEVEKSEVYQSEQLDKLGMEVIPVDMRDAYAFGGGLHCCTADVYCEGELKDYFPKQ